MAGDILFNNARGEASTLQMAPPFSFSDVKMTVFPLQANLARLTQFCDSYLNQAGEFVQFKPFLPFVYLIILDYGKMSAPATQTGWVSQREVAFGVPLQWLEPDENGQMAFKDFAFTTPFIFVDNELSLSTGREVYGWPKLLARLDPRIDEWIKDPHGARRVFEIRSRAAADHVGDDLKAPFLSVTQTPLTGLFDFPPNLRSATQAAAAWPKALVGMTRMLRDAGSTIGGLAMERARKADRWSDLSSLANMRNLLSMDQPTRLFSPKRWAEMGDLLSGIFPELYSNTINLKQFRDAENPMRACYQAITAAKMPIVRFGGGGFLGAQNLMMGQLDGGYRVNIINTSTVPVVSHLGLVEAERAEVDGGLLSSFAPVCPFWIEIDMVYDLGQTIAMRTRTGEWCKPGKSALETAPVPIARPTQRPEIATDDVAETASAPADPDYAESEVSEDGDTGTVRDPNGGEGAGEIGTDGSGPSLRDDGVPDDGSILAQDFAMIEASNPFNTSRGASEALGGVFRFKDAHIRVLPLMADPKILGEFVKNYIQVPGQMEVEAWGNHVYMLSTHYESITSDMAPGKQGDACEVTFAVPVKCYDHGKEKGLEPPDIACVPDEMVNDWRKGAERMTGTAMITPFSYVDDITAAITESEVFGVPTLRSEIVSPPDGWAAEEKQCDVLLEARAIVVPSLGTGVEGTRKTLIQVRSEPAIEPNDTKTWSQISTDWGGRLAEDLVMKCFESGDLGNSTWHQEGFNWGRAMALRIMGGLHGVNTLSLKQFRDASYPDNACYQGVVMRGTSIEELHSLEEIETDLTVSITRFPTQPIAKTLGLIPKHTVVKEDGVCDEFEPIRPFEIRADIISSRGKTLFERSGTDEWDLINLPDGPLGWRPVSEDEVSRAWWQTPNHEPEPKISYVRVNSQTARPDRVKPRPLNEGEHESFLQDVRRKNVHKAQMLWRGVELGALLSTDVLNAMDDNQIDDIHGFVRTRTLEPGPDDDPQYFTDRIFRLAGSLEMVSPATILDSILSRGWASKRHAGYMQRTKNQDFRIRRNTLGPELADVLFPERESQDGYWPLSTEHAFSASLRDAMMENSLPYQFRRFLDFAKLEDEDQELPDFKEIARRTLPEWFFVSAFERRPLIDQLVNTDTLREITGPLSMDMLAEKVGQIKSGLGLLGVWPKQYKIDLHNGIQAFFDELARGANPNSTMPDQAVLFGREWSRVTGQLVAEAVPDAFDTTEGINLDDIVEAVDLKGEPPTPGWLKVRLKLQAANHESDLSTIKQQATDWERSEISAETGIAEPF